MTDLTLWHYLAIAALGVVASIVNILAGGGSNLILPLLMMFGGFIAAADRRFRRELAPSREAAVTTRY